MCRHPPVIAERCDRIPKSYSNAPVGAHSLDVGDIILPHVQHRIQQVLITSSYHTLST